MRVLVLDGPNLNLLGTREPVVYGHETLGSIQAGLARHAGPEHTLTFTQSNHEGALVDAVQSAIGRQDGLLVNAGAPGRGSLSAPLEAPGVASVVLPVAV